MNPRYGMLTALALFGLLSVSAARAENAADCLPVPTALAGNGFRVSQDKAMASVEISNPDYKGRPIEILYNDETFSQTFGPDGAVKIAFALVAERAEFSISIGGTDRIRCTVSVPEFNRIYRAILRWHDPVQFDLHVLEPGGRIDEKGYLNTSRRNLDGAGGIGRIDVANTNPRDDATGEISYRADLGALPPNTAPTFKVDYATRGASPEPPFCGDGPLAAPKFELIQIVGGKVTESRYAVPPARCREPVPDSRRLYLLR